MTCTRINVIGVGTLILSGVETISLSEDVFAEMVGRGCSGLNMNEVDDFSSGAG